MNRVGARAYGGRDGRTRVEQGIPVPADDRSHPVSGHRAGFDTDRLVDGKMVDLVNDDETACLAMAGLCLCVQPKDHAERDGTPHRCEEETCQSAWRGGDLGSPTFEAVEYPIPLRALLA